MRRGRAALGATLLIVAAAVALLPSGAGAATLAEAGWWWRVNDGALPAALPAPPNVPEGGLMVAGAPDGATAIAALHFDLAEGESAPVLTLRVAENGDQGGDGALLGACVTGSAWQPAHGGPWTNKPFAACADGSVNGVRSDDGTSWTFALAPLVSDGILDITLVPGVDPTRPAGANGSVFQLVFDAPTAASLTTTSGASGGSDLEVPSFGTDTAGSPSLDTPPFGGDLPPAGGRLHPGAARSRPGPHRHRPGGARAQRPAPHGAHRHGGGPPDARRHRARPVRRRAPLVLPAGATGAPATRGLRRTPPLGRDRPRRARACWDRRRGSVRAGSLRRSAAALRPAR
jgi:hypothetical protein